MPTRVDIPEPYNSIIPPAYHKQLRYILNQTPEDTREDALQAATVAILTDGNPLNAARKVQRDSRRDNT